jgi:hypothetical protein
MSPEKRINKMLDTTLVHFNMCFDKSNRPSSKEHYRLSPSKNAFVLGERDFVDYFLFIHEKVPQSLLHFIHEQHSRVSHTVRRKACPMRFILYPA